MKQHDLQFYSEQALIHADLFLPDDYTDLNNKLPVVIVLSGFQGFKDIHPARFARKLTQHGFACMGFDYRGWGDSEGKRGKWSPQDQVEDVHAAISMLEMQPEIDFNRIGVLGWGLGGSIAVAAAAHDVRVNAVAACNAIADGKRSMHQMHTPESWAWLVEAVAYDRRQRAIQGSEPQLTDPFSIIRLDEVTKAYVDKHLYAHSTQVAGEVTLQSAELLMRFSPEDIVHRIAPRPTMIVYGGANQLHRPEESKLLYQQAREPKRIIELEGKGHTEWMFDENPTYERVVGIMSHFFKNAPSLDTLNLGD